MDVIQPGVAVTIHVEKIPVLFFGKNIVSKALLPMRTFSDIGQTIAVHLGIERLANGKAAELR